ncbi:hypothetical protein RCL1_004907 [Eukaryota sp. TZLM3-RCL]
MSSNTSNTNIKPPHPGMEKLIPIINKLQDVFTSIQVESFIDLPQLVVVGAQSSGKSSVLENIVGRSFLPRGSGIVTRRPLVLQLINTTGERMRNGAEEYGVFLHKSDQVFTDFNSIRDEIANETSRLVGKGKAISSVPINLKIFSPYVLNLTMVDLPGVTKIAIDDQPADIETQIRNMVLHYIQKPNAIILAVSAANTDLANSDALQLARVVDPEGRRTLGIITKLDLMDQGTDAMDILTGKVVSLRLGFIGVVNRSQADIVSNKNISDAVKDEHKFFVDHPKYKLIANKLGTPFLAKALNFILMNHIHECLPEIKDKIRQLMNSSTEELRSLGGDQLIGQANQGALLLKLLTSYAQDYCSSIDGKLSYVDGRVSSISTTELWGGARLSYVFHDILTRQIEKVVSNNEMTNEDIRTAIRNATGPRTSLFVPEDSFELLAKRQIARLEAPALRIVELVYHELVRIIQQCPSQDLKRFSNLSERVTEVAVALLRKCLAPTKKMIIDLIQIELAYINTNHPDFLGAAGAINKVVDQRIEDRAEKEKEKEVKGGKGQVQPQPTTSRPQDPSPGLFGFFSKPNDTTKPTPTPSSSKSRSKNDVEEVPSTLKLTGPLGENEHMATELISKLLESYFTLVAKKIRDTVPKTIMHFLVNQTKDLLQNELVQHLYKDDMFDQLLAEDPEIAARRKMLNEKINILKRAFDIVNEVRDLRVY